MTFQRSPRVAKSYYVIKSFLYFLLGVLIYLGVIFLKHQLEWPEYVFYVATALLIIDLIFLGIDSIRHYVYHTYQLDAQNIYVRSNLWFRKYQVMKQDRIQYIKVTSKPLMRYFKLRKVTIYTAGHEVKFPLVHQDEAKRIQEATIAYLEGVDSDV
ncbi:PH domain-containing protein [Staphylococcus massiliensis]|uniref:PH domain-containing protein n=1 Tax=Staphylococcus massiliensis TaxID=555791 RepID=UPI00370D37DB